jgi:hypothetical protein
MSCRYFLRIFLPTLSFETPPELSWDEVESSIRQNLSSREVKILDSLFHIFDIENVKSHLLHYPMTSPGSISHEDLRRLLEHQEPILPVVDAFLENYPTEDERKMHAHELLHLFLKDHRATNSFVRAYFSFENSTHHVLAYLRAKSQDKPYTIADGELDFDLADTTTWPEIFLPLFSLWQGHRPPPQQLEETISRWKFVAIDELSSDSEPFSLDRLLSYLIRLRIITVRQELHNPRHLNTLERIRRAVQ